MPFEITNQGDFLFFRLYGVFTAAELNRLASEAEIVEDALTTAMDRVTDATSVERFEIGFSAVYSFAARRRTRHYSKSVKSAIIAQEPLQFGFARMYEELNENPQIKIRIVQSLSEAEGWFGDKTVAGTA